MQDNLISIRSTDLRTALNIAPATMNDLLKKTGVQYLPGQAKPGRGAAKDFSSSDSRRLLEAKGFVYPTPAKVISFMMCKGGVGKTTSSFFVANRMAAYGARILVVDGDSQGNLTSAFDLSSMKIEIDEETPILVDLLTKDASIDEAIIAFSPFLHLIPSTPLNSILESKIRDNFKNPSVPFSKIFEIVKDRYDYIIIDCAPALNLTNTAIICASDLVVLPVAPDKFSQIGLEQTLKEIHQIEEDFPEIGKRETRVIFTRFDAREYTSLKYLSEIADSNKERMFKTMIRTASDLKNAITKKEDLFQYKNSNAKDDYDSFVKEIMGIDTFFSKKSN